MQIIESTATRLVLRSKPWTIAALASLSVLICLWAAAHFAHAQSPIAATLAVFLLLVCLFIAHATAHRVDLTLDRTENSVTLDQAALFGSAIHSRSLDALQGARIRTSRYVHYDTPDPNEITPTLRRAQVNITHSAQLHFSDGPQPILPAQGWDAAPQQTVNIINAWLAAGKGHVHAG